MSEGNYLVGVDIGSSAIKVCQLRDVGRKKTLVKFGYYPLPPQTIVDGHVMNQGAIVEGLNRIFAEHKIKQRDVALSVSGHSVIIKRITMPLMTAAELAEQIQWETEQQIPFDINEVQTDYEVLRRRPEQGQMDVLLVAAKKDEVGDHAAIAQEAKLRPKVIDVDAFAVQNVFEVNYGLPSEGTYALINVGNSLTTLNILSSGAPAFTRDILNGGSSLTEEIQKRLGISYEDAERYKTGGMEGPQAGAIIPQEVPAIVRQSVDSLAGEIQRSLDFYLATSGEREVQGVFITGGTSNIAELGMAIERRAGCRVEQLNAFKDIAVDDKSVDTNVLRWRAAQCTVAMGLALRHDREKR